MYRFFQSIIKPIFELENIKRIVEIGADEGKNTLQILEYCSQIEGALTSIDPSPRFDKQALKLIYGQYLEVINDLSLISLQHLKHYDCVLIDGDHNWYTVFNELNEIEKYALHSKKMPIVFLHDTEWPYGRRDMYYLPDTIPSEFRKEFAKKGILQGQSPLSDQPEAINSGINNALYEGGSQNGVLTAVEDFLQTTTLNLSLHKVASHHGLGILTPKDNIKDKKIDTILKMSNL
ncbi:class I SAM-dependent methyltransferase [Metabacillus herbersteinensis]|uniref:Class I SAM-dependent methyltransferase n=2 Tax=Metabacillus herbersteinensis TaxID=283816 RepID=A0ABV6GEB3_9BACI